MMYVGILTMHERVIHVVTSDDAFTAFDRVARQAPGYAQEIIAAERDAMALDPIVELDQYHDAIFEGGSIVVSPVDEVL